MRYKKRKLLIVIIILLMIFIISYPSIFIWSPMCCRYEDVDINTGRIRYTRYLLYCKISEKVKDSILTETIAPLGEDTQPNWKRVNTFSPGVRHSPHYRYHSSISQIHMVEILWELCSFSDEAKRYIAQTVLSRWQTQGDSFGIDIYLNDLWKIADQKAKSNPNIIISVADLTSVPVK